MNRRLSVAPVLLSLVAGCGQSWSAPWFGRQRQAPGAPTAPTPTAEERALTESAAFQGTVASFGYFEGLNLMEVRGYGIVAGLGEAGSRECPESVRKLLIDELEKKHGLGLAHEGLGDLPPEKIIDSLDTAVVEVAGAVPAAAGRGTPFDLRVAALSRTQAVSLAGGRLYTCDLKLVSAVGIGPRQAGPRLALAAGPLFVNPFTPPPDQGRAVVRAAIGRVLGGGITTKPRRLRLRLIQPSYSMARQVSQRLNERFGHDPQTADAISPSVIRLTVPREFRGQEARFVDLASALYVRPGPGFPIVHAKRLAQEIVNPSAPHVRIANAWECMGRTVLPVIQALYTHEQAHVRFFSARAGLRLDDDLAIDVLAALARNNQSSFQKESIRQLGDAREGFRATDILKPLLHHADPRIRVAAYQALLGRRGSGIRTYTLGKHPTLADYNFKLDVIPSAGPGLIHAHATGKRRIAIFGADLACKPPVFYLHPDQAILINALETDQNLTLIRRARFADTVSPPIPVPLTVVDLVRKLGEDPVLDDAGNIRGVGMGYDQTILILHTLCGNSTIPAKFMFDRPSITDLTGPLPPEGRPETDL